VRRLLTFFVVAVATAVSSLYWLYDGDLSAAVTPVLEEWGAAPIAQRDEQSSDLSPRQ